MSLKKRKEVQFSFFPKSSWLRRSKKKLKSLENKSSSGCDNYTNTLVQAIAPATNALLADFINLSFKNGVFPNSLRCAKVIPLHKNDSKDCVKK